MHFTSLLLLSGTALAAASSGQESGGRSLLVPRDFDSLEKRNRACNRLCTNTKGKCESHHECKNQCNECTKKGKTVSIHLYGAGFNGRHISRVLD